jgi:hypothetical protein
MENWKAISGYESVYEVSDLGNVRRVGRIRKLSIDDVEAIRLLRDRGETHAWIAERFGVTKHAVIVALTYKYKRGTLREMYRLLKPQSGTHQYLSVGLCKDGKVSAKRVHQLVVRAFIGEVVSPLEINHKNGIRTDNRAINLEIVTRSANRRHAIHVLGQMPKGFIKQAAG